MGSNGVNDNLSLESIRKTLIGLEDTIVFSLIERAKFPLNSPAYQNVPVPGFYGSLMEHLVRGSEVVQAQSGRYQSPEEVPFFPNNIPPPFVNRRNCPQELPPAAASVSANKDIWEFYVKQFVPLLAPKGDDGNYALSVSSDLICLQALSRRIHFGKFVAEVKFRSDTEGYSAAIRAKDKDTLMKLLTDVKVEEMVKQRVAKKAMVFGQDVTLSNAKNTTDVKVDPALVSRLKAMVFGQDVTLSNAKNSTDVKVDPALVSRLYDDWVIPLTKVVEVEYLLRRLD